MRFISNLILLLSIVLLVLLLCSASLASPSRMVCAPVSGAGPSVTVPEEPSVVDPAADESWWDAWIKEVRRIFHPAPLPSRWVNAPKSGAQKAGD